MAHLEKRDPELLGNTIKTMLAQARARGENPRPSEIAELIDRGAAGHILIHPCFMNGRSSEQVQQFFFDLRPA